MGFSLRDFIGSETGGIVGGGKQPAISDQAAVDNYVSNPDTWSPADSMKDAAKSLSSGDTDAESEQSKSPTMGQTLMSLRNGGLGNRLGSDIGTGVTGGGWSF